MNVFFFDSRIKKFIDSLGMPTAAKVANTIELLKNFGNRLRLPYSKQLQKHLYELRTEGQPAVRLFYTFHGGEAVILHVFIKKTQKTPRRELDTAVRKLALLRHT